MMESCRYSYLIERAELVAKKDDRLARPLSFARKVGNSDSSHPSGCFGDLTFKVRFDA